MVLSGKGKVTRNRGSMLIPIPAPVAKDSQIPFKVGDEVSIRIDGDKVIIEKVDKVYVNVKGYAPDFSGGTIGVACPPQENNPNVITLIAGNEILVDDPVKIGNDGKAYSCIERVKE